MEPRSEEAAFDVTDEHVVAGALSALTGGRTAGARGEDRWASRRQLAHWFVHVERARMAAAGVVVLLACEGIVIARALGGSDLREDVMDGLRGALFLSAAVAVPLVLLILAVRWMLGDVRRRRYLHSLERDADTLPGPIPVLRTWTVTAARRLVTLPGVHGAKAWVAALFAPVLLAGNDVELLAGLPFAALLSWIAYVAFVEFGRGDLFVRFADLPLVPDGAVVLHLGGPAASRCGPLTIVLRGTESRSHQCREVYLQERRLEPDTLPDADSEIVLEFPLERWFPPSTIALSRQTLWEFEVRGSSWGVPFRTWIPVWISPPSVLDAVGRPDQS